VTLPGPRDYVTLVLPHDVAGPMCRPRRRSCSAMRSNDQRDPQTKSLHCDAQGRPVRDDARPRRITVRNFAGVRSDWEHTALFVPYTVEGL